MRRRAAERPWTILRRFEKLAQLIDAAVPRFNAAHAPSSAEPRPANSCRIDDPDAVAVDILTECPIWGLVTHSRTQSRVASTESIREPRPTKVTRALAACEYSHCR